MTDETAGERMVRIMREEKQAADARDATRKTFLDKLFGSAERLDWLAPGAIEDFDTLLCMQAAQLQNAVNFTMEDVLSDHTSTENRAKAAGAVTRMIQTSIAIARTLDPGVPTAKSKTIHGVRAPKGPQA